MLTVVYISAFTKLKAGYDLLQTAGILDGDNQTCQNIQINKYIRFEAKFILENHELFSLINILIIGKKLKCQDPFMVVCVNKPGDGCVCKECYHVHEAVSGDDVICKYQCDCQSPYSCHHVTVNFYQISWLVDQSGLKLCDVQHDGQ